MAWCRGGGVALRVLLVSRRHLGPCRTHRGERDGLADALRRLTTRFDNLFESAFLNTMGFHQRHRESRRAEEWPFPRAFLSAAAALGHGWRQVHGGFDAGHAAAGYCGPRAAAERLRQANGNSFLAGGLSGRSEGPIEFPIGVQGTAKRPPCIAFGRRHCPSGHVR